MILHKWISAGSYYLASSDENDEDGEYEEYEVDDNAIFEALAQICFSEHFKNVTVDEKTKSEIITSIEAMLRWQDIDFEDYRDLLEEYFED